MSITCKNLSHIYGEKTPFEYYALKNVNLDIQEGSFTAIIGQTGSGKSTFIQHINALLLPTDGQITIDKYTISSKEKPEKLKQLRKKSGLVFQFLQKSPFDLSGGQKRRIAIAGILAMDPDILVLDEPTAGLDPQGIREMMDLFKSIHQLGKTVILVTHDMNHVLEYCNEVIVMNEGCVERKGKVKDVFKDSDYLLNLGIDLPLITNMIIDLNKKGFQLDTSINNIDDLVEALGGELYG